MIPVGVACSCLVVSYLCVYATGKGRGNWFLVGDCARAQTLTLTLNTYLRKLESWDQYGGMCVLVCVCSRAPTLTVNTKLSL